DRLKQAQKVGTVQSRAQAWENSDLGRLDKANRLIYQENEGIRKLYQEQMNQASKGALLDDDGKAIKPAAILKQMQDAQDAKRKEIYGQYGLTPDKIKNIRTLGTDKNPFKPTSADEFHALVRPGQYFINPSDGKVYMRKQAAPAPMDYQYNPGAP